MSYKMLIVGAGKQAQAIAYEFVRQKDIDEVCVASRHLDKPKKIKKMLKSDKICPVKLNAKNFNETVKLMKKFDCAVSAVPYQYNYDLARAAVKAGCNFIDLGGNVDIVKKEFSLSKQAKKNNVAIIPDCGLAPGLVSNLAALAVQKDFKGNKVKSVKLRVGGLPQHPKGPLKYMIVFSVHGLINEYIEPVLVIDNYKLKTVEPMQDVEELNFPGFGKMEAFNTSGGTSTMPQSYKGKIKELNYKTIRYPGHAEKVRCMMYLGLTSSKPREVEGCKFPPRELLEDLFKEKLSYKDKDLVLLKVIVEGTKKKVVYTLVDKEKGGLTAMTRCTGFPAGVIAEMIVRGDIKKKGALKHEFDVPPQILYKALKNRGLNIKKKVYYG
ncbi:hypothetical protein GF343_05580 [Candidatus Woesearchaeota archaeon]|nr:hypothetical protein [Candidatus Woesearchaeota archaeon]